MKRGCFIVILLLISVYAAEADTTWVQGGSISGTWTAANSPYMILGNISLSYGGLSIGPGVTVYFTGPYSLTVDMFGALSATGTAEDSILFTTDTLRNPDRWRGLHFQAGIFPVQVRHVFEHCIIENALASGGTSVDYDGGGIRAADANDSILFRNCTIRHNIATGQGGGVCIMNGAANFKQCVFFGNRAAVQGGAIYEGSSASLTFFNCSVIGNYAPTGAGICDGGANAYYNSCIIISSNGSAVHLTTDPFTLLRFEHCDIFGVSGGSFSGAVPVNWGVTDSFNVSGDPCDQTGNIFLDPELINPAAGDFHLRASSPCINAGDTTLPRDSDGTYADIGAFPVYAPADTTHIAAGSISGRWTRWGNPYRIEGNVTVAAGDSLKINPGVVVEFAGPFSFTINGKLTARGTETDSIRFTTDTLANPARWRGLRFINADSTSRMEYCIVEHGGNIVGGGVYCESTSCRFANCMLRHNRAEELGGGVYIHQGRPEFIGCEIVFNEAPTGGGLAIYHANVSMNSCRIDNNQGGYNGGGIFVDDSDLNLEYTSVSCNNIASGRLDGDAIDCDYSGLAMTRCTVVGNCPYTYQILHNAIYAFESAIDINSTIFSFNHGRALNIVSPSADILKHCDFYGQTVPDLPSGVGPLARINANGDSCDSHFNIFLDPQLVDTTARDFRLQPTSPCIHAGDPALPHDPDETAADIGAFYYDRPYSRLALFDLLMPHNNDTLIDTNRVRFLWHGSFDGDCGDTVTYTLYLDSGDSTWTFPTSVDTTYTVDLSVLSLDLNEPLLWWVQAHSQRPDMIMECEQRFRAHLVSAGTTVPENSLPHEFALHESFPNPFNAVTAIRFDVPHAARVKLSVYDVLGREAAVLQDGFTDVGTHRVLFDAGALPSGVYFCRMTAGDFTAVKKLLLAK